MRACLLDLKSRYAYCPNSSVDRNREAKIEVNRANHARSQRHITPARTTRAEPQDNQKTRTEAAIRCYEYDGRGISRENAQPGSGSRRNSLIHQAGKTRPNVRSVRTCLAIS